MIAIGIVFFAVIACFVFAAITDDDCLSVEYYDCYDKSLYKCLKCNRFSCKYHDAADKIYEYQQEKMKRG